MSLKVRNVRFETFSGVTLADVQSAYNNWRTTSEERDFVGERWLWDGTNYVFIVYYIG